MKKPIFLLFFIVSFLHLTTSRNVFDELISIPTKDNFLSHSRVPLFLGIFAKENHEMKSPILDFILQEVQFCPDLAKIITDDPQSYFLDNYHYPSTFHITTFYMGGDSSKMSSPYYTSFKEGEKFDVKLDAIAFVPDHIITGITFPDRERIMIENRFPHVTLMLGDWSAVDSNAVMESLFDDDGPMNQYYSTDFFESMQPFYEKFTRTITYSKGTETVDVYVIKFAKPVEMNSITKKGYF